MRPQKAKRGSPDWCWAACLATVFDAHGYRVIQDEIVTKVFPSGFDHTMPIEDIVSALGVDWKLPDGRELFVDAELLSSEPGLFGDSGTLDDAVQEMIDRNGLICDVQGRPALITHMSFAHQDEGEDLIAALTVLDPWPGNPSPRTIGRQEALRVSYLARVLVGEYS
jgi:hypothetical protein